MRVVFIIYIVYFCSMKALIATLSLLTANPSTEELNLVEPADTLLHIEHVEVTASLKQDDALRSPIALTALSMNRLEEEGIASIKELSLVVPNFYQPDYGSSITSSIYVRGFGSRIDQPTMGVVIDDIPIMNKNAYDFDFYDIRRIELLRGPQGTLYGRNTSGGVMNITTLSPMAWQGTRIMAEYATLSSARASVAYYTQPAERLGISVAANYSHNGGHFLNTYINELCDVGNAASVRLRAQVLLSSRWSLDNTLTASYVNEGGYAYRHYIPSEQRYEPIAYNDPSRYERLSITEGFVAKYEGEKVRLSSATSYQFLDDCMTLDQDFSTKSMFTMQQMQREHVVTEDIVIRNVNDGRRWQWLTGLFAFGKWLDMSSPVTFKRQGIDELILANANKGLHTVFPEANIDIGGDSFVIGSDFRMPTYGAALYHQSNWQMGRWRFTAGLRLDYEYSAMSYFSRATIDYRFDMTMSDYKPLTSEFKGRESQHFFEFLPKVAVEYDTSLGTLYGTITRGYKAGGFNTQIFSDILQVKMMNDLMEDLGVYLDNVGTTTYDSASATRYKPETSWNFEVGAHLKPFKDLKLDAALFWIECFDQQVTVLPEGNNTGRMMSNAARARSFGVELSAAYNYEGLGLAVDYGFTDARFRSYNDGVADYAGRYLPYAPKNTLSVVANYTWHFNSGCLSSLALGADMRGVGEIYWNEANTLSQPLYVLLGVHCTLRMGDVSLTLWGRNLSNCSYNTFYFKSVGEEFFAEGRPIEGGVRLNINL